MVNGVVNSETKNGEIIKDAIKKQKAIDFCNDKLYKSRKYEFLSSEEIFSRILGILKK